MSTNAERAAAGLEAVKVGSIDYEQAPIEDGVDAVTNILHWLFTVAPDGDNGSKEAWAIHALDTARNHFESEIFEAEIDAEAAVEEAEDKGEHCLECGAPDSGCEHCQECGAVWSP